MKPGENVLLTMLRPFSRALDDPRVTEIVVNRCGEFGVETAGKWSWHDAPTLTFERLDQIGILAASMTGQDFDPEHPLCVSTLPDGERVQICRPSATEQGTIAMCIRRPSSVQRTIDDADFEKLFMDQRVQTKQVHDAMLEDFKHRRKWAEFFRLAVQKRKNIAITGPTGSGKTDIVKRLLHEIPEHERLISIEDAPELNRLRHRNRVALYHTSGAGTVAKLTATDLVKAALRMRPDRIILAECRDGDAFSFLRVLALGHPGSMTTWHAERGEAFEALGLMVRQHPAGVSLPPDIIDKMVRQNLDIVVWCAKDVDVYTAPEVWLKGE